MAFKHEEEVKQTIRRRLRFSNAKKWHALSPEQQEFVVNKYFEIRDRDYLSIAHILREYAEMRRDATLLFLGVALGTITNLLAAVLIKYFPSSTWVQDLFVGGFFLALLLLFIYGFQRFLAQQLDDEDIIDKLLGREPKD